MLSQFRKKVSSSSAALKGKLRVTRDSTEELPYLLGPPHEASGNGFTIQNCESITNAPVYTEIQGGHWREPTLKSNQNTLTVMDQPVHFGPADRDTKACQVTYNTFALDPAQDNTGSEKTMIKSTHTLKLTDTFSSIHFRNFERKREHVAPVMIFGDQCADGGEMDKSCFLLIATNLSYRAGPVFSSIGDEYHADHVIRMPRLIDPVTDPDPAGGPQASDPGGDGSAFDLAHDIAGRQERWLVESNEYGQCRLLRKLD